MACGPLSILLRRRLFLFSLNPKPHPSSLFFTRLPSKPFSTSHDPSLNPKSSSLSARLSFVFDQIDAIEKERSQKDQTLQRIRAWRESKKTQSPQNDTQLTQGPESELGVSVDPNPDSVGSNSADSKVEVMEDGEKYGELAKKEVEVVHPWPEWIELMERLVQQNYFDHRRKDEDKMVSDLGFDATEVPDDGGFDFTEFKSVQTACLNFGKDRFDILRSLSRKDIQILVGFGCPTVDNKVVFSAKLLRKHAHLDEGDVCSSCSLRNSCARAYLLTNKEDEARTIDVMRVLLTFGFDPVNGSVMNKSILKQKSVKTVVRKLLHEVVKLSAVPIDPSHPPPVIKRPPPKVKQPPPPPKKRVGRDDIEMKKGDWLCPKCDFMNFAKNTVCLQCDAKRPKRQLLPGEWECPECNFLNYRRNMVCFHCQCKRPPDEFLENKMLDTRNNSKPRLDKRASRPEVSSAWNFDFDDNESDGADVAAFEYADAHTIDEDFPSDSQTQSGNLRGLEGDVKKTRVQGLDDGECSNSNLYRPGIGFDDFEDDDDDDIDSYELETHSDGRRMKASKNDFSEVEDSLGLDDGEDSDDKMHCPKRVASKRSMQFGSRHDNANWSEDNELDFDSDDQPSVHSNFKSSHAFSARQDGKGRGPRIPSKKLSFGSESDEDVGAGLYTDDEDDLSKVRASRRNRGIKHDFERSNVNKARQSSFKGSRRRELFNDEFDGPSRQSYGNGRGYRGSRRNLQWVEDRARDAPNFDRSCGEKFRRKQQGRFSGYHMDEKEDFGEFRNSRRVIER